MISSSCFILFFTFFLSCLHHSRLNFIQICHVYGLLVQRAIEFDIGITSFRFHRSWDSLDWFQCGILEASLLQRWMGTSFQCICQSLMGRTTIHGAFKWKSSLECRMFLSLSWLDFKNGRKMQGKHKRVCSENPRKWIVRLLFLFTSVWILKTLPRLLLLHRLSKLGTFLQMPMLVLISWKESRCKL